MVLGCGAELVEMCGLRVERDFGYCMPDWYVGIIMRTESNSLDNLLVIYRGVHARRGATRPMKMQVIFVLVQLIHRSGQSIQPRSETIVEFIKKYMWYIIPRPSFHITALLLLLLLFSQPHNFTPPPCTLSSCFPVNLS